MRKILYSPGFGAGWTSWFHGSKEAKKFMLEYKPFIEFLENGGKFIGDKEALLGESYDQIPVVRKFIEEFQHKFPEEEAPFFSGLEDLAICKVPDNCLVSIHEYDGSESVRTKESIEDQWL